MSLRIIPAEEMPYESWDEYLLAHPEATGYHLAGWRKVVKEGFGHGSVSLVAAEGRTVRGLLPLFMVRRGPLRPHLITGPFGSYDGAVGDSTEIETALYEEAKSVAGKRRAAFLLVKSRRPHPALEGGEWRRDPHFSYSWLETPGDPRVLWKGIRAELRNRIRRAEKSGLAVRRGREHLDRFYRAYSYNMRDLGSPVQPKRFFAAFLAGLGERADLFTVWRGDEVIGGATYFSFKGTAYTPWVGCMRPFFQYSPNQLLYWTMISEACDKEKVFDFGRSTLDADGKSGTQMAKQKWPVATAPIYHYYYFPAGEVAFPVSPESKAAVVLRGLWKKLPVPLANVVGPRVLRYYIAL